MAWKEVKLLKSNLRTEMNILRPDERKLPTTYYAAMKIKAKICSIAKTGEISSG